jgi:hypothetical protein
MNTTALTHISKLVIESATRQGISLHAQFGTRERFQSFIIALTIQGVMDVGGLEFPAAYDLVMGDGAYRELSDAVWEAAQAGGAA